VTVNLTENAPIESRVVVRQQTLVAIGIGLLSLGISLWELTASNIISIYDSGVYVAASILFISGAMPYRDFTFVQPPGIVLFLSPVALFSRFFGTYDGLILARVLSCVVAALNTSLIAWFVRKRGALAMMIAGGGLAVIPVAIYVSSSVKIDSYCLFFVLLGSIFLMSRTNTADEGTTRSLVIGGALFGIAGLMKLWAAFPFLAAAVCLVPLYRRRVIIFIGSSFGVFTLACLPFFFSSPTRFLSEVFIEQLNRKATRVDTGDVSQRLIDLTGFLRTSLSPTIDETLFALLLFIALTYVAFRLQPRVQAFETYLLLCGVFVVAGLLLAHETFIYYGYFAEPFLLGLLGVVLARLIPSLRKSISRTGIPERIQEASRIPFFLAGVTLLLSLTIWTASYYSGYASSFGYPGYLKSAIDQEIPVGTCVVYDVVGVGVYANRFIASDPSCPNVVDPGAEWMAWGYELIPPAPRFVSEWKSYFTSAQFVVLVEPNGYNVPWNKSLRSWFYQHYSLKYTARDLLIYENLEPS
jgi:hypothetical protein